MKTEGWVQHTAVDARAPPARWNGTRDTEMKGQKKDIAKISHNNSIGRGGGGVNALLRVINPGSTLLALLSHGFSVLNPPPCWITSLFLPQVCSVCPRPWSFSSISSSSSSSCSGRGRAARGTPTASRTCAAWSSVYWPQQWAASRNSVSLVFQSLAEDLSTTQSEWCFESFFVGLLVL